MCAKLLICNGKVPNDRQEVAHEEGIAESSEEGVWVQGGGIGDGDD